MTVLKLAALLALVAYLSLAAALYAAQTSIFFPARLVPPAGPLPPGAERVELVAPDGVRLHGVIIPPARPDPSGTVILGFAGNASNAAAIAEFLATIYPEHPVAAFHYRGYAPSAGSASAATLLEDAPLLHDYVRARLKPKRLIVVGISIGSGVAAGLAARRPIDGLILVTPFDSLEAVARERFPWLPVALLIRHELPSAATLRASPVSVAIVAAERDGVVPPARTSALASAARNLVYNVTIPAAQHNDVAFHPSFRSEMRKALEAVVDGASASRRRE